MRMQIPPEAAHFVNQDELRRRALRAVAGWERTSRPPVLALSGRSGYGKTELGYELARRLAPRHPDGVLYVNLDDFRRDGVVEVADVLGYLLTWLGVPADALERSFPARRGQYWSRTADARLSVLVDNARYGSEVTPLLPPSGASTVIVTSHGPLHDLERGVTVELPLRPLGAEDSTRLLHLVADDPRLAAEPDAARGLVDLCSGLPIALRVAGRWLRERRRGSLARLLTELTAELQEKGLPEVERVWNAAYRSLRPEAAELYRLLALCPGPTFTDDTAAALLGRGRDAADDALDDLERAGLLDGMALPDAVDVPGADRKRLPPLLRAHAERRARQDGTEEERDRAARRIVRWYLRQAQRADRQAAGVRLSVSARQDLVSGCPDLPFLAHGDLADPAPPREDDPQHRARVRRAVRWLEDERLALGACVALAHRLGMDAEATALCEPLWTRYLDHPHPLDDIETLRTGLAAAQRAEDVPGVIRIRCQLARPLWERGDPEAFAEAQRELDQAASATAALGDDPRDGKLRASVIEFHGMLRSARGDWAGAAEYFQRCLRAHQEIPNPYGVLLQTYRLGQAVAVLGQVERAAALLTEAHREARRQGRERLTARIALALAGVLRKLDRADDALPLYRDALASAENRDSDRGVLQVREEMAGLAEELGDAVGAAEHRAAARAVRERLGLG